MTKKILIAVVTLAGVGALFFLFNKKEKPVEIPQAKAEVNQLPYLNFVKLDGTRMTAHDLPGKTILVMFNTDCDHCQREAKAISDNLDSFKGYTLYFLASESVDNIQKFAVDYHLAGLDNVLFGRAEVADVVETFGPIATPSIYIYSLDRRLVKNFNGETGVDEIISHL